MFISRLLPPAHKAASYCTYKPLLSMRKCRSTMKIQITSAGLKYHKCWKCKSVKITSAAAAAVCCGREGEGEGGVALGG